MAFDAALHTALIQGGMPPVLAARIAESTITVTTAEKHKALIYSGIEPVGAYRVAAGTTANQADREKILGTKQGSQQLINTKSATRI